jgi:hypothetical protein
VGGAFLIPALVYFYGVSQIKAQGHQSPYHASGRPDNLP